METLPWHINKFHHINPLEHEATTVASRVSITSKGSKKVCVMCMWLRRLIEWQASHILRTSHDYNYAQLPGWEPFRFSSNVIPLQYGGIFILHLDCLGVYTCISPPILNTWNFMMKVSNAKNVLLWSQWWNYITPLWENSVKSKKL